MTRAPILLAALLAAGQGSVVSNDAARGAPITVHAVVEDAQSGLSIANITASDVEVSIDGQPGSGIGVSCGEPPLTLVVLIDVSASLDAQMPAHDDDIRKAAERLFATLRDGDRVRIGVVAATPALSPAFLADRNEMVAAARQILRRDDRERHGPSPIWDALDLAVAALAPEPGRRAVVLFTDGRTTGNRLGYTAVAGRAVAAGVAINVVSPFGTSVIQQSATVLARVRPQVPLGRLAEITGGVLMTYVPGWPAQPEKVLLTIVPRIRTSCAISFAGAPADALLHRLDVRVKRPGVVVHAPQGVFGLTIRTNR